MGKINKAGLYLLAFCSINNLSIWFEKRNIHKQTWQHLGTKKWHAIDFILMKQSLSRCCIDVQVMRRAECWSDHKLVRVKLRIRYDRKRQPTKSQVSPMSQIDRKSFLARMLAMSLTSSLIVV